MRCYSQLTMIIRKKQNLWYIGIIGGTSNTRYSNQIMSFSSEKYEKEIELQKYIWDTKNTKIFDFVEKIIISR